MFPLTDPGAVFAVLFLLVLLGPLAAARARLRSLAGLIVAGMLVGLCTIWQHFFNLVASSSQPHRLPVTAFRVMPVRSHALRLTGRTVVVKLPR